MREILSSGVDFLNHFGRPFCDFAGTMLVQVTILVLVLLALEVLLRNRVTAVVRYWLWLLVLVKLVLPVGLHTPASLAYWLPAPRSQPSDATASLNATVANGSRAQFADQPGAFDRAASSTEQSRTEFIPFDRRHDRQHAAPTARSAPAAQPELEMPRLQLRGALFGLWILGVALLLTFVARRALWVRRMVRQATIAPAELHEQLRDCLLAMGMPTRVNLKMSDCLGSPAICGLWRPTILLPSGFPASLDHEQIRMVFVHELVHWRRGDLLVNCCQTLLQILYFYSPAVWLANLLIRRLREQAVDETVLVAVRGQPDRYASTLLDLASAPLRPLEATLSLTGVVESRKALATRIKRITRLPIPKTAKLGLQGVLMVVLAGVVLLPMAGRPTSAADEVPNATDSRTASDQRNAIGGAAQRTNPAANPADGEASLNGRLIDETGKPVTDAQLELISSRTYQSLKARSDANGNYRITVRKDFGEYRILINSKRWVGITDRKTPPRVDIAAKSQVVRDFTLPRACRLRIQTVDEQGKPIGGVQVFSSLSDENQNFAASGVTDQQGWASLDGLKGSNEERLVATMIDGYAFAHMTLKLDDPAPVAEQRIVLKKAVDVKGTALCTDGKPASGWRVNAMPTWWHFGTSPMGELIGSDGSFTLRHVAAEKYDVIVDIPSGERMSIAKPVLTAVALPPSREPLRLTVDYPSPASMATIAGQIEFSGDKLQRGIHIFANSTIGQYSGSAFLMPGQQEFTIGPVPRGTYRLQFDSTEIEPLTLSDVVIPSDKLHIKLKVRGTLVVHGTVMRGDTHKPVTRFRAQVTKLRTLSGPNYEQETYWHEFKDNRGTFAIDVAGPGIYTVLVSADGLASNRSAPFNTDTDGQREIHVELKPGTPLMGKVVDEQGRAIDGAKIIFLPGAVLIGGNVVARTPGDEVAQTRDGTFTIPDFTAGEGLFKVVHPDFSTGKVGSISVDRDGNAVPLKIVLHPGATVHGHVYDEFGRPEANVTLHFQDRSGYGGPEELGRLAKVVTDPSGFYEVRHLPDQFCYVKREDPWRSFGVVRQAVLTTNGKTQTLDLGGTTTLSGRLILNGAPLANGRVQLSDDNPNFGIFKAFARTDERGAFTFFGPAAGKHTLYAATSALGDSWVRVKDCTVTAKGGDLGTIETATVRLTVQVQPSVPTADGLQIMLQEYDPIWPFGISVGAVQPRASARDPFVFEQVPLGKYELVCYRPNQFTVRKTVELKSSEADQTVLLDLPRGTASLHGKLAGQICGPDGCRSLKVWSADQRLLGGILPKEDGIYRLENIPAGDYAIKEHDTRDAETLLSVSLKDGENKTLDITPATIAKPSKPAGYAVLRVFTTEGVPITGCDIRFEAAEHPPMLMSSQEGRSVFTGVPGSYAVTIGFPGFTSVRRTLELKPESNATGANAYVETHVQLQPDKG